MPKIKKDNRKVTKIKYEKMHIYKKNWGKASKFVIMKKHQCRLLKRKTDVMTQHGNVQKK